MPLTPPAGPVAPYYSCYMGLSALNSIAQDLVGPRTAQHKTFIWIKSFIILRNKRATGELGFFLVTPKSYYHLILPNTFRNATQPAIYFELNIPRKTDENPALIRMSISPQEVQSQEQTPMTPQGVIPTIFPPGTPFAHSTLYETPDPDFFPTFVQDLKKRIPTLHSHYLAHSLTHAQATEAQRRLPQGPQDYIKELKNCLAIPNSEIQALIATELTKLTPPSTVPETIAVQKTAQLKNFTRHCYEAAKNFLPKNPKSLLKFSPILLAFLIFRIRSRKYYQGVRVIKKMRTLYGLKPKRGAKNSTYSGIINDHVIEISHSPRGKLQNMIIGVEVKGEPPDGLEIKLKSRAFTQIAQGLGEGRMTDPLPDLLDDEFFEKYVQVRSSYPAKIGRFLTPWRKSILRQCLCKMDVSVHHSQLIYRHPEMIQDVDTIEGILHSLLNTTVLMTPK